MPSSNNSGDDTNNRGPGCWLLRARTWYFTPTASYRVVPAIILLGQKGTEPGLSLVLILWFKGLKIA